MVLCEELARMEAASADNVLASNASSSKESANLKMFSGVGRYEAKNNVTCFNKNQCFT